MKVCLAVIIALCFASGCRYGRVTIDRNYTFSIEGGSTEHEYMAKWFDGSNTTSNFCIRAGIYKDWIGCYVINMTSQCMIVHRGIYDLPYAIKYRDSNDVGHYSTLDPYFEYTLSSIEILEPARNIGITISPYCSLMYKIPIPKDCVRILAASVAIEYVTFSEMQQCKDTGDLANRFQKNAKYVLVEFFDKVEIDAELVRE